MSHADQQPQNHLERLWDTGQRHLAAGRYPSARQHLESAEALAWRHRDAAALASIYLPLMEARRQFRQNAVEGPIVISAPSDPRREQRLLRDFLRQSAGTCVLACDDTGQFAGSVQYAARRRTACLEALILCAHKGQQHLGTPADPRFSAGLPVRTASDPADLIVPDDPAAIVVPLPPPGWYAPGDALHALARESLLVAWEALALKWQARHPQHVRPANPKSAWEELAWLRLALRIDPACEPVMMRLIAVAEALARH